MKIYKKMWMVLTCLLCFVFCNLTAQAKTDNDRIPRGIFIDDIELSGMTYTEAKLTVESYVSSLEETSITLSAGDDKNITVTAKDLGIYWANTEVLEQITDFGTSGNIVERYKELKDLEKENVFFKIEFSADKKAIRKLITEKCGEFNVKVKNATLSRINGEFVVEPGAVGVTINTKTSVNEIFHFIETSWNRQEATIALATNIEEPIGKEEELIRVKDVLGTYTTSYSTSSTARTANVVNACGKVSGHTVYPGEEFSTATFMVPFTPENGYYEASSYAGGRVVESVGGGICQVSSTLYNAVLLSELEVTVRYNHAMIVSYVKLSADATISEDSGLDFKFINNTEYPIYVEGYTTKEKKITFTIYGVENRPKNRTVSYESETLSVTPPEGEIIYVDSSKPVGYIDIQSAHTGYTAKLWKIVKVDGVEVSRTEASNSKYKMAPRSATVGTATADPAVKEALNAAMATGNIDYTHGIINQLATGIHGQAPPASTEVEPELQKPIVNEPAQAW
ncbi:MAG TPA: VanW family protein [Lachnospiraceae bacterium]|nr:VanW family protein [Lachnospiraceae bacterium]